MQIAPRLDGKLLAAIAELDDRAVPMAETNRRVGALAERLGLPRPSYEQVRTTIHEARNGRRRYGWSDAVVDISFRVRSPQAVAERLIERPEARESM